MTAGYRGAPIEELCASFGLETLLPRGKIRQSSTRAKRMAVPLGLRWPVERTNSWFSNFGQLRRNPDRFTHHRDAAIALAVVMIITVKLVKWAKRWNG